MPADDPAGPATVATRLRLGTGVAAEERADIVARLGALDSALARYPGPAVELELSVKDREGRDLRTTLECWIADRPRLVASSGERHFPAAVVEVRGDLRRQLDDGATRREPMNNRHLRHPGPVTEPAAPPRQPAQTTPTRQGGNPDE